MCQDGSWICFSKPTNLLVTCVVPASERILILSFAIFHRESALWLRGAPSGRRLLRATSHAARPFIVSQETGPCDAPPIGYECPAGSDTTDT